MELKQVTGYNFQLQKCNLVGSYSRLKLKDFNIDTVLLRQTRWGEKWKTSCNEHSQPAVWQHSQ